MRNICRPMNNTLSNFIDICIIYENNVYSVEALTDTFKIVRLGAYDFLLDAYARCCQFGFEVRTFEIPVSAFENRVVEFNLD